MDLGLPVIVAGTCEEVSSAEEFCVNSCRYACLEAFVCEELFVAPDSVQPESEPSL
jgi:hypothetical protein